MTPLRSGSAGCRRAATILLLLLLVQSLANAEQPRHTAPEVESVPARLLFVDRHSLAFERAGVLAELATEGSHVRRGEVVARMKSEVAAAALAVARARVANEAEVVAAQLQFQAAEAEFQAARTANAHTPVLTSLALAPVSLNVFESTAINRLRLAQETAAAEIEKARKEHTVYQRSRDQAEAELDSFLLHCPLDGLVTRGFKRQGEGAQAGEAILEVLSTRKVRVEADIKVSQAVRLVVGQEIEVLVTHVPGDDAQHVTHRARLGFVDPTVERVSKTVRVWADIDNEDNRLREGLPAKLQLPGRAPVSGPAR